MNLARKLELGCGLLTALLGLVVTLMMVHNAYEVALRLEREFSASRAFLGGMIFFVPSFLTAIGAYAHAARRKS